MLVSRGVKLSVSYAATEIGSIMRYFPTPEDRDWAYLTTVPHVKDYVLMKPFDNENFQCVILKGCPGCEVSNSDDPPGSYRTKDLFVPHKTSENRWKFVARLDDCFSMANMENVLPLEFEGNVTKEPLVREAIVFGAARPVLGLLVCRSDKSRELNDEEFVSAVWPAVEKINSTTSPTARIQRQMIIPMPAERTFPQTDKSTFIRARTYKEFDREIEMAYERLEQGSQA